MSPRAATLFTSTQSQQHRQMLTEHLFRECSVADTTPLVILASLRQFARTYKIDQRDLEYVMDATLYAPMLRDAEASVSAELA